MFLPQRLLLSLTLPAAAVVMASAAPVSLDEAISIAAQALSEGRKPAHKAPSINLPEIFPLNVDSNGQPALYAVNFPDGGFAIVSGDDRTRPVLGYSYTGSFDPSLMPPAMAAVLNSYASHVTAIMAGIEEADTPADVADSRTPVAPLLTTTWNQGTPYNVFCPKTGVNTYAPVGCAALSMGQSMRYHAWPPKSRGQVVYGAGKFKLNTEFDWAAMPNSCVGQPASVTDPVAKMLYEAGRSIYMNYTGNQSGTYCYYIPDALVTNFSYDTAVDYISRAYYSDIEWGEIIYAQLAAGMPVPYDGIGDGGGHAFVTDGYDKDGYFHINWGWEGKSDGYFLLDMLHPTQQGIGGSNGGYNRRQGAVINMRRPQGGSQPMRLSLTGSLAPSDIPGTLRVSDYAFEGWDLQEGILNLTGRDFTTAVGARFVNVENPGLRYEQFNAEREFVRWSSRTPYIKIEDLDIPDGRYFVYPVSRNLYGECIPMDVPAKSSDVLEVTVAGGTMENIKKVEKGASPAVSVITLEDKLRLAPGFFSRITAWISPLDADAELTWTSSDEQVAVVVEGMVIARREGSVTITAAVKGNEAVNVTVPVEVRNSVMLENIAFNNEKVSIVNGSAYALELSHAPADAWNTNMIYVSDNEDVAEVSATGVVTAKSLGTAIITATTTDGSELTASVTVEVSDGSSVGDITGDTDATMAPVYNLQGIKVLEATTAADLKHLPAGIYIHKGRKIAVSE